MRFAIPPEIPAALAAFRAEPDKAGNLAETCAIDSPTDAALQRCRGAARLTLVRRRDSTAVGERFASAPLRWLVPRSDGAPIEIVIANVSGGVAGGDRLDVEVEAGPETDATLTTQAAEKVYRALDTPARITTRLRVGEGARLEWLPHETILFDGARLDRSMEIEVSDGASGLFLESLVLGRTASGETFEHGSVVERWSVNDSSVPLWRDCLLVSDGEEFRSPAGLSCHRALATLVYAGPDAQAQIDSVRAVAYRSVALAGASFVRGLLVVRVLAADPASLRNCVSELASAIRSGMPGRGRAMPRVWSW